MLVEDEAHPLQHELKLQHYNFHPFKSYRTMFYQLYIQLSNCKYSFLKVQSK